MENRWLVIILFILVVPVAIWYWIYNNDEYLPPDIDEKAQTLVFKYKPNGDVIITDGNNRKIDPVSIDPADPIGDLTRRMDRNIQIVTGGAHLEFSFIGSKCRCKQYGDRLYCAPNIPECYP